MATATGGRCSTFCGPRSELITYFGAGHLFLGYDARGTIRIRCESVRTMRVAYLSYAFTHAFSIYLPRIIPKNPEFLRAPLNQRGERRARAAARTADPFRFRMGAGGHAF